MLVFFVFHNIIRLTKNIITTHLWVATHNLGISVLAHHLHIQLKFRLTFLIFLVEFLLYSFNSILCFKR